MTPGHSEKKMLFFKALVRRLLYLHLSKLFHCFDHPVCSTGIGGMWETLTRSPKNCGRLAAPSPCSMSMPPASTPFAFPGGGCKAAAKCTMMSYRVYTGAHFPSSNIGIRTTPFCSSTEMVESCATVRRRSNETSGGSNG